MPPDLRQLPRRLLMALVRGYRLLLSPWLGSSCRFEPTCSRYALEALERHGAAAGTYLTLARIARCHPVVRRRPRPCAAEPPRLFAFLTSRAAEPAPSPSTEKTAP